VIISPLLSQLLPQHLPLGKAVRWRHMLRRCLVVQNQSARPSAQPITLYLPLPLPCVSPCATGNLCLSLASSLCPPPQTTKHNPSCRGSEVEAYAEKVRRAISTAAVLLDNDWARLNDSSGEGAPAVKWGMANWLAGWLADWPSCRLAVFTGAVRRAVLCCHSTRAWDWSSSRKACVHSQNTCFGVRDAP
jgi:hypothetical protein